jgi:type IV pilus assembly protein PilA
MPATAEQPKTRQEQRGTRGFSLVELLIVVGIILVIAAIAIPSLMRSEMRANAASAVENLRTVTTAETVYSTEYGIGFTPDLPTLGGSTVTASQTQAALIDSVLATGNKSGYSFTYTVVTTDSNGDVTDFSVNADPIIPGSSGDIHYYTDQSSIIRQNCCAIAGPNDQAIQ